MATFNGKHIWIIGASSGIGRALAVALSKQGAILALSARREDALKTLNSELGDQHHVFPLDISDSENVRKTAKAINASFGQIDSIIFMAALYDPTKLDALDITVTHKIVDVNLNGAFNIVHAALPILQEQQNGQIALCGSVAGYRGLPKGQPYSATKAAVINLAESLKTENPHLDIKVINPGFVRTPMTDKNTFEMPMMIEPDQAANDIVKGLQSRAFEIHFPKKFTWIMKLLKILPDALYFKISKYIQ